MGDGCAELGRVFTFFFCAAIRRSNTRRQRTVRLGVAPNAASVGVAMHGRASVLSVLSPPGSSSPSVPTASGLICRFLGFLSQVDEAYARLPGSDVLDLGTEGARRWAEAREAYDRR